MTSDAEVLALYHSGVEAVREAVSGWDDAAWARPACGVWDGTQLAGHLVTVIGWYHSWLDRALAGDPSSAFPIEDLDAQTAAALAALAPGTGPERIARFVEDADHYAVRLTEHWDVPYGYPRGTVTAGLHAAVAAVEWHVHARDFAVAAGSDHEPADAAALFVAAAHCQFTAAGGIRARVGPPMARVAAHRDPWGELLRRVGRQ